MPFYYHSPSPEAVLDRMEALVRTGPGSPIADFVPWASGPAPAGHFIPKGLLLERSDEPSTDKGNFILLHVDGDPEQAFEHVQEIWNVPLRCQLRIDRVKTLKKGDVAVTPSELCSELLALFTGDILDDADVLVNEAAARWASPQLTVDLISNAHGEVMNISDDWETEVHVTFTLRCRFPVPA